MEGTLKKIIDYAVNVAGPQEIVLFGSMANATITQHSDVDLLIVCKDLNHRHNISARLQSFANEVSLKIDILVFSRESFVKELAKKNSFVAAIYKKGKIVYKKEV